MNSIESASPNSGRTVVTVAFLGKAPDSTPNPHLWYDTRHHAEGGRRDRRRPVGDPAVRARRTSGPTPSESPNAL